MEHLWGIRESPQCECGQIQTMLHIIEDCPLTKLPGGLMALNNADEIAVAWVNTIRLR